MRKKLFIVSDLHGYFKEFVRDLTNAGFDVNNENHLLIVAGDIFDRGPDSKEIYKFLRKLQNINKAIVLKGNHDNMFIDFLKGKDSWFNFIHNGMKNTFDSFLERTMSFESFITIDLGLGMEKLTEETYDALWKKYQEDTRRTIISENDGILEWFTNLPDYYETKNYIITHASIDTEAKDWHSPEFSKYRYVSWDACHWDDGSFFGKELKNTDKKIVVGHYHTDGIREKFNLSYDGTNSILERDDGRIICIDTCTPRTKRVNVLIIDDEELL